METQTKLIEIPVNFKQYFAELHNYLYANSNMSRNERLGKELLKIILCKLLDEKKGTRIFSSSTVNFPNKFKQFFNDTFLPMMIDYGVFSKNDELLLDDKSLIYVGEKLREISLLDQSTDVLGAVFEVFAEGVLAGDQGQFFTPLGMVSMCVEMIMPKGTDKIIDPACGSGGFLNYAVRYVKNIYPNSKITDNVYGIDKDSDLVSIAKGFALIISAEPENFKHADSLKLLLDDKRLKEVELSRNYLEKFDIVLTNPPFGAKIKIPDEDILRYYDLGHVWKYDETADKWIKTRAIIEREPQILFIELCIKLLKPGGKLAIVLPDGILGNTSDGYVRQYILQNMDVLAVIDCPHDSFMPHTHTKTSVLIAAKKNGSKPKKIFFGSAKQCGIDSRGTQIFNQDGTIKEDFSKIVAEYLDFINNKKESGLLSFAVDSEELNSDILVPSYYDPNHDNELKKIGKREDILFYSIRKLIDDGYLSIKNAPASASKLEYGIGEVPFIRTTDISNGEMVMPATHKVSKEVYLEYKSKQDLQEGDILFVKDGTFRIGQTALIIGNDVNSLIQSHFKIIRVLKDGLVDPYLLFYLLNQKIVLRQIEKNTFVQATLSTIGNRLLNVRLPIPKSKEKRDKISKKIKTLIHSRYESRNELLNMFNEISILMEN